MPVAAGLLSLSALLFPFSVAATNVALGVTLAVGLFSGLWWQGALLFWQRDRVLAIIFMLYFGLLLLGLLWSSDLSWGLHVVGRHWLWLLLPVVIATLADERRRRIFLIALSVALTVNLGFCVLQKIALVTVTTDGSSAADATGHIGHIGFGFVYGIWSAWLVWLGLMRTDRWRWLCWGLSCWAIVMVFLAQGRSGYLVVAALLFCVLLRWGIAFGHRRAFAIAAGLLLIAALAVSMGPAGERLHGTIQAFMQPHQTHGFHQKRTSDSAFLATQQRFFMWRASIDIWQQAPLFGVGTGAFPAAVADLHRSFVLEEGIVLSEPFKHPHNQFLLVLARLGIVGLILFAGLLAVWLICGWRTPWLRSETAPLFLLTGVALLLQGLFSSAAEEHFSAILSVVLLGVAMSDDQIRDGGGESCN